MASSYITPNTSHQYKSIIINHPFFKKLTASEIDEFVALMSVKQYLANQVIVNEGEIVDAIYLIVAGTVEVSRNFSKANKIEATPIAVLRVAEAIGLSETGFFSHSGLRTATAKAISNTTLLRWDLTKFHDFLLTHPSFAGVMEDEADLMLRMSFIKQAAPFEQLTNEKIAEFARRISEINVTAGTILFREGEVGAEGYLIQAGKVELFTSSEDVSENKIAILEPPALLGEIALLTALPRNATARMSEDGKLLVFKREQLYELMEYDINLSQCIMSLTVEHFRPKQLPNVDSYQRMAADGNTIIILKDAAKGNYFQLSQQGWFIWEQLNGQHTLQDIVILFYKKFNIYAQSIIVDIIFKLADAGFITFPEFGFSKTNSKEKSISKFASILSAFKTTFSIQYLITEVDAHFTSSYRKGVYLLFTPLAQVLMILITVLGLISFVFFLDKTSLILQNITSVYSLLILILIFPFYALSIFLHELGHAYATKASGYEVRNAGIKWFLLGLVVFVDTSDMWLADKSARIRVNFAGAFVDMVVAGLVSICVWFVHRPEVATAMGLFALILYYSVFKNLNPIIESDGYYILMDVLDKPNLRASALTLLVKMFPNVISGVEQFKKHKAELIYWLACLTFLLFAIFVALVFQHFLRELLPHQVFGIHTIHLGWLLPILIFCAFVYRVGVDCWRVKKNLQ